MVDDANASAAEGDGNQDTSAIGFWDSLMLTPLRIQIEAGPYAGSYRLQLGRIDVPLAPESPVLELMEGVVHVVPAAEASSDDLPASTEIEIAISTDEDDFSAPVFSTIISTEDRSQTIDTGIAEDGSVFFGRQRELNSAGWGPWSEVSTGLETGKPEEGGYDFANSETKAFVDRMSIEPDDIYKEALDVLVGRLKAAPFDGLNTWDHIHILALHSEEDAKLNLLGSDYTLSQSGAVSFEAGVGFKGGSGYLSLGNAPDALNSYAQDSASVVVVVEDAASEDHPLIGMSGSGEFLHYVNPRASTGNFAFRLNGTPGLTTSASSRIGVTTVTRDGSELAAYRNGAQFGSWTQASSTLSGQTEEIRLFDYFGDSASDRVSFWAAGSHLDASQVQALYDAVMEFRAAIGLEFPKPPAVDDNQKLTWTPPKLSSPTIVNLDTGYTGYTISGENEDVRFIMPTAAKTGRLYVPGTDYKPRGRNVEIIGGKFGPMTTSGGADPVIRIGNCKGGGVGVGANIYCEGLDLDLSARDEDGFQGGGRSRWAGGLYNQDNPSGPVNDAYYADSFYIQNCRITGMHGVFSGYHADFFHNDFGLYHVRIDRFDGETNYQGIFVRENATANNGLGKCPILGSVDIRNAYMRRIYTQPMDDEDATSFVHMANNKDEFDNWNRCQRYIFDNFWINDPNVDDPKRAIRPASIASIGSDSISSYLHWPDYGVRIQDAKGQPAKVRLGVPPAEVTPGGVAGTMLAPDFFPGLNYNSPGYKGA